MLESDDESAVDGSVSDNDYRKNHKKDKKQKKLKIFSKIIRPNQKTNRL